MFLTTQFLILFTKKRAGIVKYAMQKTRCSEYTISICVGKARRVVMGDCTTGGAGWGGIGSGCGSVGAGLGSMGSGIAATGVVGGGGGMRGLGRGGGRGVAAGGAGCGGGV